MDAGRAHWMRIPFWEEPSELMLDFPPRCWVQLALVFIRVDTYLDPITLSNTYSINYLAVWGQEEVDAGGANWMTLPFWEASIILIQIRHTLMDLVDVLVFME